MIAKGTTHNNGARLAAYMIAGHDGQRAELWQLRGFGSTDIKDAFRSVHVMAEATKCEQPFFHVQVRNRAGEKLTRQQWEIAADRIQKMLGLTGQPRAIAFHIYENGDEHMHLAVSLIDAETMKARRLPFFKYRLKTISRELEKEFGLQPVKNTREGPIKYAPTRAQDEQARRLGVDLHEVRNTIRACWDRSDNGRSFQASLEDEGLTLALGDRRGFVVIDHEGGIHALGKRILDVTPGQIKVRLSDLSREELPSVAEARALVNEIKTERAGREKAAPVWDRDRDHAAWQDAVINAAIAKEKVERQFVEPRKKETQPPRDLTQPGSRERMASSRNTGGRAIETPANIKEFSRIVRNVKAPTAAFGKVTPVIGKMLETIAKAAESLLAPTLTPQQIRDGEKAKDRRDAEAENTIDFSRVTADRAEQNRQIERDREADRQSSRDGGGRER